MTTISKNFGSGAANIPPGGEGGTPTLPDTLQDVADDLLAHRPLVIVSPDGSDPTTTQTLVNEIKALLNACAPDQGMTRGTIAGPWDLTPSGKTLTAKVDGGSTLTSTITALAAVLTGTVAGPYDLHGGTFNLRVIVNGRDPSKRKEFNVQFVDGDFVDPFNATATEVATKIGSVIGASIAASVSTGFVRITTARLGTGASVQAVGGSARGVLGLSNVQVNGSGDAFNLAATTLAEMKAKLEHDYAGAEVLDAAGRIALRTHTVGGSGSIQVTGGTAASILGLTDTAIRVGTTAAPTKTLKSIP